MLGGWLNLVLVILTYDTLDVLMSSFHETVGYFRSPYWFVADGMIAGVLIDWAATRFGGEGKACL